MILYFGIIVLGALASLVAPWWAVALVIFGMSFWKAESAGQAALVGTAALTTLWVGYATFLQATGQVDMAGRIAGVLAGGSSFLAKFPPAGLAFTVLTFLAGLVGSTSGVAGYNVRNLLRRS